ncbi:MULTISPECIES: DUF3592 domain-containing protein [Arthrobacter]|uniref:DUF3592 domain-containing protein n=1 Tax=Arthrobacter gyeryongensis TaxID=1650592 RepID=A0ABP9S1Z0_9MICC|nr:DUF3592 domain-containing protein [Arthrobacter bambusae]MDQ0242017.1 hypothetical protein [Arthrobacter bambusae]
MKDRPGNDVPVDHVGEGLPSSPREMVGGVESWSVALPDGVNLKASPHLDHQPPAWQGSSLRRRMRLTVAAFTVALTAVVIAAGFGLGAALAPFTAGSVRTGGTVTSQQPYRNKGGDYLCTLGIAYTLGGQQQHATIDSGKACKAALQPGTQVQLALNPDNPGDIAVLGHGYPRENAWRTIAIIAAVMAGILGLFLLLCVLSYRDTKRLFSQERPWQELIATVRGRTQSKSGTTLYLEAQDTTGNDRIVTMLFNDRGPRPKPKPGDILDFALLADGAAHAAVSIKSENRLHLVSFSVPNDFQLRAIGL